MFPKEAWLFGLPVVVYEEGKKINNTKKEEGIKMLSDPIKGVERDQSKDKDKHIVLNEALNKLERLPERVGDLLKDITGAQSDPKSEPGSIPAQPIPNLSITLTTSPERIDEVIRKIEETLNSIRTELF